MSANPLVQSETMETKVPAVTTLAREAVRVTAAIIVGLVATALGAPNRGMDTWAETERVKWYRGCGR